MTVVETIFMSRITPDKKIEGNRTRSNIMAGILAIVNIDLQSTLGIMLIQGEGLCPHWNSKLDPNIFRDKADLAKGILNIKSRDIIPRISNKADIHHKEEKNLKGKFFC